MWWTFWSCFALLQISNGTPGSPLLERALFEEDDGADSPACALHALQIHGRVVVSGRKSRRKGQAQVQELKDPQFVLVSGHSKNRMSQDPFYKMMQANKAWAAQSLGMGFVSYWSEDVQPKGIDGHFSKVYMLKNAVRTFPDSEFFLFMDSFDSWFHPRLLELQDNGRLMSDIAAQIPRDKHFIFAPVWHLNSGVFIVRNSAVGRKLLDDWQDVLEGPSAPKCHPWDQAGLYTVFLKEVAKRRGWKMPAYECQKACGSHKSDACIKPFEDILHHWGIGNFTSGTMNRQVPIFHSLAPVAPSARASYGIPRLHCFRCTSLHDPVSPHNSHVLTRTSPVESSLRLEIPWMINHVGNGHARALFPDTSGMLQCDGKKPQGFVLGVSRAQTLVFSQATSTSRPMSFAPSRGTHFFNTGERQSNVWQRVITELASTHREGSGFAGFKNRWNKVCDEYAQQFSAGSGATTLDSLADYHSNPYAAEWIRLMFPKMKIFIALQDPSLQIYERWRAQDGQQMKRYSLLSSAVESAVDWTKSCMSDFNSGATQRSEMKDPLRDCVYDFLGDQGLSQGLHLANLLPWMAQFPKQQVHLIHTEELRAQTPSAVSHVANFLNIDHSATNAAWWTTELRDAYNVHGAPTQKVKVMISEPLQEATPDEKQGMSNLCRFYDEENKNLANAIEMDFNWCGKHYIADRIQSEAMLSKVLCRGLVNDACQRMLYSLAANSWYGDDQLGLFPAY